ncbi:hypothetical protein BGZ70_003513 [Mortierella alpina]|uniref:Uncharacterized protein n=1 Tax=Mortierella alpina TaxID=64518 RepID=A0A9P6IS75_MORAP|nr:hypothetical protein BGZ70_003513 [Mortierella alpina]
MDPEMRSDRMISQYYLLLNESKLSTMALSKSVHQAPAEAMVDSLDSFKSKLSEHVSTTAATHGQTPYSVAQATAKASLDLLPQRDSVQAMDLSEGYGQLAGTMLLADEERQQKVGGWKNAKKEKLDEERRQSAAKIRDALTVAQRAVMAAPWNHKAWQVVGVAAQTQQRVDA